MDQYFTHFVRTPVMLADMCYQHNLCESVITNEENVQKIHQILTVNRENLFTFDHVLAHKLSKLISNGSSSN